ncbi:hypothetical protein BGZ80_008565 [Entomortierella chlamydospora]|uniref:Transmembrane protein n=1 Tax=Entomortierella chlamydospora TaxID=101097 RepID=A0A9P6MXU0_9FUNG|nr:hypothetical protein BGZ79_002349 [Entomortierella chlamydospora]KAG0017165.1 hypothetical protein BGZ80_008565 [Entomortierella chlamydospora]
MKDRDSHITTPQPQSAQSTAPEPFSQENIIYPQLQQTPEEAPPSYEAVITKDIPQIHDNYDHLRGPPSQRGKELKDRIPPESLSSSYYQPATGAGASSSSSSSEAGPSVPQPYPPIDSNYGSTSSGPISTGGDEEADLAQDIDRLLGAEDTNNQDDETDSSCWTVAGDGQAWAALGFFIVLLLPWTLFCFAWTLAFVILSSVLMIIPPLGYLFTVMSVTSWRALARVDLVLSAFLVSDTVQARFPYIPAEIFIAPEPGPGWKPPRIFGYEMPLPEFIQQKMRNRHASRSRRPRNLCYRGAKHMKAILDRHTISSMFYFLIWKMMFGIIIFIVVVILFSLTVPFMICFLPSLLVVSRTFANWQYRWAVTWLSEKPAPIVL